MRIKKNLFVIAKPVLTLFTNCDIMNQFSVFFSRSYHQFPKYIKILMKSIQPLRNTGLRFFRVITLSHKLHISIEFI